MSSALSDILAQHRPCGFTGRGDKYLAEVGRALRSLLVKNQQSPVRATCLPEDRLTQLAVLLVEFAEDTDVPLEQSQLMAQEFQKHGIPFQFHQIAKAEQGLAGGDRLEIEEAQQKAFEFVKLHLERP